MRNRLRYRGGGFCNRRHGANFFLLAGLLLGLLSCVTFLAADSSTLQEFSPINIYRKVLSRIQFPGQPALEQFIHNYNGEIYKEPLKETHPQQSTIAVAFRTYGEVTPFKTQFLQNLTQSLRSHTLPLNENKTSRYDVWVLYDTMPTPPARGIFMRCFEALRKVSRKYSIIYWC